MAKINLLPWREDRRQELKKTFLVTTALVAIISAGLVLLGDRIVNGQIEYQNSRNSHLTQNIRELDKKVAEIRELQKRRNQLIERMRVIQELHSQYVLGFSPQVLDGKSHKIEVRLVKPGLKARARSSYIAK